jgi:hypothetical protein
MVAHGDETLTGRRRNVRLAIITQVVLQLALVQFVQLRF